MELESCHLLTSDYKHTSIKMKGDSFRRIKILMIDILCPEQDIRYVCQETSCSRQSRQIF